jgi:hypothetical protein
MFDVHMALHFANETKFYTTLRYNQITLYYNAIRFILLKKIIFNTVL